jgi:hypothetical protein
MLEVCIYDIQLCFLFYGILIFCALSYLNERDEHHETSAAQLSIFNLCDYLILKQKYW